MPSTGRVVLQFCWGARHLNTTPQQTLRIRCYAHYLWPSPQLPRQARHLCRQCLHVQCHLWSSKSLSLLSFLPPEDEEAEKKSSGRLYLLGSKTLDTWKSSEKKVLATFLLRRYLFIIFNDIFGLWLAMPDILLTTQSLMVHILEQIWKASEYAWAFAPKPNTMPHCPREESIKVQVKKLYIFPTVLHLTYHILIIQAIKVVCDRLCAVWVYFVSYFLFSLV